jgi:hypothetical protein
VVDRGIRLVRLSDNWHGQQTAPVPVDHEGNFAGIGVVRLDRREEVERVLGAEQISRQNIRGCRTRAWGEHWLLLIR